MWLWLAVAWAQEDVARWDTALPVTVVPPVLGANGTTPEQTLDAIERAVEVLQAVECVGDLRFEIAAPANLGATIPPSEPGIVHVTVDDPEDGLDEFVSWIVTVLDLSEFELGSWGSIALNDTTPFVHTSELDSCTEAFELQGAFVRGLASIVGARSIRPNPYWACEPSYAVFSDEDVDAIQRLYGQDLHVTCVPDVGDVPLEVDCVVEATVASGPIEAERIFSDGTTLSGDYVTHTLVEDGSQSVEVCATTSDECPMWCDRIQLYAGGDLGVQAGQPESAGCGCATSQAPLGWLGFLLLPLVLRARREAP